MNDSLTLNLVCTDRCLYRLTEGLIALWLWSCVHLVLTPVALLLLPFNSPHSALTFIFDHFPIHLAMFQHLFIPVKPTHTPSAPLLQSLSLVDSAAVEVAANWSHDPWLTPDPFALAYCWRCGGAGPRGGRVKRAPCLPIAGFQGVRGEKAHTRLCLLHKETTHTQSFYHYWTGTLVLKYTTRPLISFNWKSDTSMSVSSTSDKRNWCI